MWENCVGVPLADANYSARTMRAGNRFANGERMFRVSFRQLLTNTARVSFTLPGGTRTGEYFKVLKKIRFLETTSNGLISELRIKSATRGSQSRVFYYLSTVVTGMPIRFPFKCTSYDRLMETYVTMNSWTTRRQITYVSAGLLTKLTIILLFYMRRK